MSSFDNLYNNKFIKDVFEDGNYIRKKHHITTKQLLRGEEPNFLPDEDEFYVLRVGFSTSHLMTWCQQLDDAIELLTNFNYRKGTKVNRASHFIYNLENYLIRINSVFDRILQLVNSVFHIGTNNEHVRYDAIINNVHVVHYPKIEKDIRAIKKFLKDYEQSRHTLIT